MPIVWRWLRTLQNSDCLCIQLGLFDWSVNVTCCSPCTFYSFLHIFRCRNSCCTWRIIVGSFLTESLFCFLMHDDMSASYPAVLRAFSILTAISTGKVGTEEIGPRVFEYPVQTTALQTFGHDAECIEKLEDFARTIFSSPLRP